MANNPHVEPLLREGQTFVGKYLIGKEVGRGGFGAVYLADDLALKRKVAIKVLHPKHATDKKTLKRFQREVWASTRLSHPSIVAVHDTGKAPDGTLYIVMEFVDGEVLQARLKSLHVRNLRIGHNKTLQVGLQVARALAAAHDKGIFHRDQFAPSRSAPAWFQPVAAPPRRAGKPRRKSAARRPRDSRPLRDAVA